MAGGSWRKVRGPLGISYATKTGPESSRVIFSGRLMDSLGMQKRSSQGGEGRFNQVVTCLHRSPPAHSGLPYVGRFRSSSIVPSRSKSYQIAPGLRKSAKFVAARISSSQVIVGRPGCLRSFKLVQGLARLSPTVAGRPRWSQGSQAAPGRFRLSQVVPGVPRSSRVAACRPRSA